jgi:hypothetical protein
MKIKNLTKYKYFFTTIFLVLLITIGCKKPNTACDYIRDEMSIIMNKNNVSPYPNNPYYVDTIVDLNKLYNDMIKYDCRRPVYDENGNYSTIIGNY